MKQIKYTSIIILAFISSLMWMGCETEKKYTEEDVRGRWEVYQGERNGKPTQTLNGAYFEFMDQNQLYTNVLGDGVMNGFNVYNNVIVQQGGEKIRYKIVALTDEKMTLSTTISGADFVLDLIQTSSL